MRKLIFALLVSLAFAHAQGAETNLPSAKTNASPETALTNDVTEAEYKRLLADDDAAQQEIDRWIQDSKKFQGLGADQAKATLNLRIHQRLDAIKKEYQNFVQAHDTHVRARIAYGSFLNDSGEEAEGVAEWEKAHTMDPQNPAVLNNLATFYSHDNQVVKALDYYEKAHQLKPLEPLYCHNLAVHIYIFRKEASQFYKITELAAFEKALDLYRAALKLDPENFVLASDYAQCFYGVNPPRYDDGLKAWLGALKLARDDIEREGVYVHLARIEIKLGQFDRALFHLQSIKNPMYNPTKESLTRKLNEATGAGSTNAAPVKLSAAN